MIKYLTEIRFNWLDIIFIMTMAMTIGMLGYNIFFVFSLSFLWFTLSEWIKLKVNEDH